MIKITRPKKTIQLQTIHPIDSPTMNSTHGKCSLYLHPEKSAFNVADISTLINALQEIGLLSKKINQHAAIHHYFTGDKYLDYIAYMGCAPAIKFEASDKSENFCFITIHQHQTAKLIHSQKQSRAPHCPNCQKLVKNWQDTKTASTINCGQCDISSDIENFNWRKMAGYAQLFIEITDIFPKEAIPQQLLLDKLINITDVKWQYFYSCQ
ncbi:MAG: hypothetical protein BMS9Abin19_1072 [Gammaproteobacteria bacterium]|nr:MAG: hypothetical protein BMS9Abin19_1072 [Gammaproteobacteria bacterium]